MVLANPNYVLYHKTHMQAFTDMHIITCTHLNART